MFAAVRPAIVAFVALGLAPLTNLFISGFRIALLIGAVGAVPT